MYRKWDYLYILILYVYLFSISIYKIVRKLVLYSHYLVKLHISELSINPHRRPKSAIVDVELWLTRGYTHLSYKEFPYY